MVVKVLFVLYFRKFPYNNLYMLYTIFSPLIAIMKCNKELTKWPTASRIDSLVDHSRALHRYRRVQGLIPQLL